MSSLEGREIDEAETDRFLDFVGNVASQNNPRDVGFEALELAYRVAEGFGVGKRRDQPRGTIGRTSGISLSSD